MTWPTAPTNSPVPTTNMDSGLDKPADARADLKALTDRVNSLESILKGVVENGAPLVYTPDGDVQLFIQPGKTKVGVLRAVGGLNIGNFEIDSTNILDWYQEGSFSPTVIGGSVAGVATMGYSYGQFVRIGKLVFASFQAQWSNHTGSGHILIGDLPFLNPFATGGSKVMHTQVDVVGISTAFNALYLNAHAINYVSVKQSNINNGSNATLSLGYTGGANGSISGSIIYTAYPT